MWAKLRRLTTPIRTFSLLAVLSLLVFSASRFEADSGDSLLDRAKRGTWHAPAGAQPSIAWKGYQESDFLYVDGKYYLFATGSQDPAWVDVYIGDTPEDLVLKPPAFTHVAPIRYPTVVKDGDTWHMWGVNPPHYWTEHWVSRQDEPSKFVYSDSPFINKEKKHATSPVVVDFAVRKHPTDGYWYGIGFETWDNAPLLLTRAAHPDGPWEKLNYISKSRDAGVFAGAGPPAWAAGSRPDPNLAFTSDGRAWAFFTGRPNTPVTPTVPGSKSTPVPSARYWRAGIVELDVATGKAIGDAAILFDPAVHTEMPIKVASDLNLVSVPGEPDRIFAETDSPTYPLALLELPSPVTPSQEILTAE